MTIVKRLGLALRFCWYDYDIRGGILWWIMICFLFYFASTLLIVSANNHDSVNTHKDLSMNYDKVQAILELNGEISDSDSTSFSETIKDLPKKYYFSVLSFIIGFVVALISYLLITYFYRRKNKALISATEEKVSSIMKIQTRGEIVSISIVVFFIILVSAIIVMALADDPFHFKTVLLFLVTNPGGFFVLVTGGATLIGTYFAVKAIYGLKNTITSYTQLLDRLVYLIETAPKNRRSNIKFYSFFLLPGYWQISRGSSIKDKLETAIKNGNQNAFQIACLCKKDLLTMLIDIMYVGTKITRTIKNKAETIFDFYLLSEKLLYLNDMNCPSDIIDKSSPKRLPWSKMASYYFFVSDDRAIIVTPIGLPKMNSKINVKQLIGLIEHLTEKIKTDAQIKQQDLDINKCNGDEIKRLYLYEYEEIIKEINSQLELLGKSPEIESDATVETLGFETTDKHIIEKLQYQFEQALKY